MKTLKHTLLRPLAIGICVLLVQTELVCVAETLIPEFTAFSNAQNFDEATVTIHAAEKRTEIRFSTPSEVADFEALIRANTIAQFIDDPAGFLVWWNQNKAELISKAPSMGSALNWQTFLAQVYIQYKIVKTGAQSDSSAFINWMGHLLSHPWVKKASSATFGIVATSFAFATGIVYGAMVAGPVAGFINAFLEPLLRPIREKGAVAGTKLFGGAGKALNSFMFDNQTTKEVATDLSNAKATIHDVRSIITIANYKLSPQQWSENMKRVYASWNHLNFSWNKLPDAYRSGRDRAMDMIVFRPKDFANSITSTMTAAEVHRQGAEQMLDRIMQKSADPQEVERIGTKLLAAIDEQMRAEREIGKAEAMQPKIDALTNELTRLGGTPEQSARVVENFRRVFVFTRQGAGILATHLLHDAQFSDMIAETRGAFEAIRGSYSLEFFHAELGAEVQEILARIEFQIDLDVKEISEKTAKDAPKRSLELVNKMSSAADAQRALTEPGSLTQKSPVTAEERVREAVGRAGKK